MYAEVFSSLGLIVQQKKKQEERVCDITRMPSERDKIAQCIYTFSPPPSPPIVGFRVVVGKTGIVCLFAPDYFKKKKLP